MHKWIKCSERLPEQYQTVMVKHDDIIEIKVYENGIFYDGDTYCYCPIGQVHGVTHWMPLPSPPEE